MLRTTLDSLIISILFCLFTDAGTGGRVMARGQAGRHACHTVIRSNVREGSHGRPPHVLTSLRGDRIVKRYVTCFKV